MSDKLQIHLCIRIKVDLEFALALVADGLQHLIRLAFFYTCMKLQHTTILLHHSFICDRTMVPQCLKITEKVSFNIASEASYVYIFSGQKLIKNAKNGPFWRFFENLKLAVK